MRYFNTRTTPIDGRINADGTDKFDIPETDPRVKSWFKPLPDGHQRAFDKDGLPFTEPIPEEVEPYDLGVCMNSRAAAYRIEADPLKIEAEYDAMIAGGAVDYTAWLNKVAEIKARYPKP